MRRALFTWWLLAASVALAAHPLVTPRVYSGKEGARVVVAWVKPAQDDRCVVLVTGTASDHDGLVQDCTVGTGSREETTFLVQRKGRAREVLNVERNGRATSAGRRSVYELTYDDAASQKVDLEALWKTHQTQVASGELTALSAFDRPAEVAEGLRRLAQATASFNAACGGKATATVDWSNASDESFKSTAFQGACVAVVDQMRLLCQDSKAARRRLSQSPTAVRCLYGSGTDVSLALEGTTLVVRSTESSFSADVVPFLKDMPVRPEDTGWREEALVPPRWGALRSLGEQMAFEAARVCSDGKGHFVIVAGTREFYFGDSKQLVAVRHHPESNRLFDPRQRDGVAEVSLEENRTQCRVTCGQRQMVLPVLDDAAAEALVRSATFAPNPHQRAPHALLRDAGGTYYFVDRGRAPGEEKSFRLFVGPKGALVQQKMTNVVSDSAGDIFSTRSGDLRLLIDREKTSEWVRKGKRTPLRLVPVADNLNVIYAELGVYAGERLGSPCDDL